METKQVTSSERVWDWKNSFWIGTPGIGCYEQELGDNQRVKPQTTNPTKYELVWNNTNGCTVMTSWNKMRRPVFLLHFILSFFSSTRSFIFMPSSIDTRILTGAYKAYKYPHTRIDPSLTHWFEKQTNTIRGKGFVVTHIYWTQGDVTRVSVPSESMVEARFL